jgi:chemotaxis protein CheY-P-specific phosphatase CheC
MVWDESKQTNQVQDNVPDNEQITASEWNDHVADQKSRGYDTVTTVTSNYNASSNETVLADASGGAVTVTLPAVSEADVTTIKKIDTSSNGVTIETPNTETIDGDSSVTITGEYITREIISDGTNYYII